MKRVEYKWVALGLLWVTYFLLQGTRQIYGATLPQIRADFGVDDVKMGVVASTLAAAIRIEGGVVETCAADVRKFADAERSAALALEKFGAIDILIPFAGGNEARICGTKGIPFYEQPVETIDWGIDVNLRGPVYFARACMPTMVKAKKGVICLIGSVMGVEADRIGAMYGAAKSGLFNFVKSLALAGGPHGIRAVCVSPGPVLTRPGMSTMATVRGAAAQPDELVNVILYLCSDAASFVTGTNILVDGGHMCVPAASV